jgi:hypothetical protein
MKYFIAIILILAANLQAANFYIKATATGSANGTSWANAWTNFNQATGYAAGDTLHLWGGIYANAQLLASAQGVTNAPITLQYAQDSGNTELARISNNITGNLKFWTINGARTNSFQGPTNGWDVVADQSWTNNIGIVLIAYNGINASGDNLEGLRGEYVRFQHNVDTNFTGLADGLNNDPSEDSDIDEADEVNFHQGFIEETCGIRIVPGGTKTVLGNVIFDHIYMTDISSFGVSSPDMTSSEGYDKVLIKNSILTRIGDDHINYSGTGITFDSGAITDGVRWDGHGDGLQTVGSFVRVRNSVFWNMHNAHLRFQFGWGAQELTTKGWQVYGNFFFETNTPAYAGAEGIGWLTYAWPGNPPVTNMYIRDAIFANNTIVHTPNARSAFSMTQRANYTNIYLTNFALVNNIWQDNWGSVAIPWTGNNPSGGFIYDETQFEFDYNIISGPQRAISYLGDQTDALALNAATIFNNNGTNYLTFNDTNSIPMHLTPVSTETSVINAGKDLSGYGLRDWEIDIFGNNRLADGTPDIGAAEFVEEGFTYTPPDGVTNGLLVLLAFDEDFTTNSFVTDWSGNGNHAYKFGFLDDINAPLYTNAPNRILTTTHPGRTGDTGYAGDFDWFGKTYSEYNRAGAYLAITNFTAFTNMSAMTVMAWAKYNAAYSGNQTDDYNATLLNAGMATGQKGTWHFGRYNINVALNETRFVVGTNASSGQQKILFPENGEQGNTTNWYHFAATFNAGSVIIYFNGQPFSTNTINNTTFLTVGDSASRPYDWISVGCQTHVGTPELEDETGIDYPNHGWMNGAIDDVRIYNRAISAAEMEAIFDGTPYTPPPPGSGGSKGKGVKGRGVKFR